MTNRTLLAVPVLILAMSHAASAQRLVKDPKPKLIAPDVDSFSPPARTTASPLAGRAVNAFAQVGENERKIKAVGTVKGTIHIKSVHGNNLGDFGCKNLVVRILPLGEDPPTWRLSRIATGDFSARKCSYSIQNVPSGVNFGISLKAEFPKGCDQKAFKPDATFPTKIKTGETYTYNLGVSELACTVAK